MCPANCSLVRETAGDLEDPGALAQAVEVFQRAAQGLGTECLQAAGRVVRPGQAEDGMAGGNKLGDDSRAGQS
jgi:hypothetical protein